MSSNTHDSSSDETQPRATSNTTLLNAHDVKKHFTSSTGFFDKIWGDTSPVKAVDGVDISVKKKETVGLVGESGCGKTTLGRTLARLYTPTAGHIEFDGKDITKHSGKQLKNLRKNVQIIFQDPLSSLNPRKTVGEIVEKPLSIHNLASDNTRERVIELFEQVGLQESHLDRYPHEFSGGQRQRVGIARALAVEPQLIVADEPVSALDVSVQAQIINLMQRLQDEYDLSYIFIAHDLSVVKHISDRVAVMYLGKIIEKGPTHDIFTNPQHPYTRALLQAIPSVEAERTTRENVLEGNPPSPIDSPSGCPFHTRCPEFIDHECVAQEPELDSVAESSGAIDPPDTIARTVTDNTMEMSDDSNPSTEHVAACHWLHKSAEERRQQAPLTHTASKSDSTYFPDETRDTTDKTES